MKTHNWNLTSQKKDKDCRNRGNKLYISKEPYIHITRITVMTLLKRHLRIVMTKRNWEVCTSIFSSASSSVIWESVWPRETGKCVQIPSPPPHHQSFENQNDQERLGNVYKYLLLHLIISHLRISMTKRDWEMCTNTFSSTSSSVIWESEWPREIGKCVQVSSPPPHHQSFENQYDQERLGNVYKYLLLHLIISHLRISMTKRDWEVCTSIFSSASSSVIWESLWPGETGKCVQVSSPPPHHQSFENQYDQERLGSVYKYLLLRLIISHLRISMTKRDWEMCTSIFSSASSSVIWESVWPREIGKCVQVSSPPPHHQSFENQYKRDWEVCTSIVSSASSSVIWESVWPRETGKCVQVSSPPPHHQSFENQYDQEILGSVYKYGLLRLIIVIWESVWPRETGKCVQVFFPPPHHQSFENRYDQERLGSVYKYRLLHLIISNLRISMTKRDWEVCTSIFSSTSSSVINLPATVDRSALIRSTKPAGNHQK